MTKRAADSSARKIRTPRAAGEFPLEMGRYRGTPAPQPAASRAIPGMQRGLLGFEILDQDLDALARQIVRRSQREASVMFDLEVDLDAFPAHGMSRSDKPGPLSISSP